MALIYKVGNYIIYPVVEMKRPSQSTIQSFTKVQFLERGTVIVLSPSLDQQIFYWESAYLSALITHFSNECEKGKFTQQQRVLIETFVARCCWYHKETLKEAVDFFKQVPIQGQTGDIRMERLRTANMLMQIPWFPKHVLDNRQWPSDSSKKQVVYLLNFRKAKGDDFSINEESLLDEIQDLRDYLQQINNKKAQIVAGMKEKSVYFHVKDLKITQKSPLQKQLLAEPFVVILSPQQELPEQLDLEYDKIEIWVDKSIEFNSLIGNYVCTERFGQFKWVNGPLVYALHQGAWLVMNNFQQASNELIVALKNIVNNGYLYSQSLGRVYASPGFRIVGISGLGAQFDNIPTVVVEPIDPETLLPKKLPALSQLYLHNLMMQNKSLGYLKLKRLWCRIEFMRRQFLDENQPCLVNNLWEGSITSSFKDIIKQELEEIKNQFVVKTVDYLPKANKVKIGRITFQTVPQAFGAGKDIVPTQYSLRIMEKISVGVAMNESILLVSQTGCGKTTLIQHLAKLRGKKLYVINMNLGSEASDLVGGFKPLDFKFLYQKLLNKFRKYFNLIKTDKSLTFQNKLASLTDIVEQCQRERKSSPDQDDSQDKNYYLAVLEYIVRSLPSIKKRTEEYRQQTDNCSSKLDWQKLEQRIGKFKSDFDKMKKQLAFSFVQGNLLKALKNGDWVLVDEINLAGNQVLQKLVPLVKGKSIMMYEKGDLKMVNRHPDFRIFGCMNPGNDHGKKHLPKNLVDKFTIIELPQPSEEDIRFFINSKCPSLDATLGTNKLTTLYFELKKKRVLSLRNLARALNYINTNRSIYGERSVYDGLVLGFGEKQPFVQANKTNHKLPEKAGFVEIFGFLLEKGPSSQLDETFKMTKRFEEHVKDLLRAVAGTQLPVLLEGPTSAGKTSMIRYIASLSGHKCIRINNHEHTDVEEYLGTYYPTSTGQLVFRQGPLVDAVRNGHWLILDELNLARSQILECLNRLLDDNRQLFLPEIQEVLKPHPHFRIFATQNPTSYSGRKTLSKAFRNRFIQLQMGEIDTDETIEILQKRVPLVQQSKQIRQYLRSTLNSLHQYRLRQKVFIKDAVITIRDLLKWTGRDIDCNNLKENFAMEGYTVIGERLRTQEEKQFVKSVLVQKRLHFDEKAHYKEYVQRQFGQLESIRLNSSFSRMAALTLKALKNKEPVLLIGETGCGKTTLAELIAKKFNRPLYSINCHKHIEASDFLGCLRPNSKVSQDSIPFVFVNGVLLNALENGGVLLIDQINTAEDSVLERMNEVLEGGQTIGVEKGNGWETIVAHPQFRIIATMNPSGDFGKKELSPALRNRFTEVWVEPVTHPSYLQVYKQSDAQHNDVLQMILKEMSRKGIFNEQMARNLFDLVYQFNCNIASKYSLEKRTLTMRDIVWVISFLKKSEHLNSDINTRYLWAFKILIIEGVEFLPLVPDTKQKLKQQLSAFVTLPQLNPLDVLLRLNFPILILTELPLHLVPIAFQKRIFFNVHTQLSDILGQYRPEGNVFRWHDGPLLSAVKEGHTVALVDLNLAQQQVIEGINSLFDYRGNIFVVDLDTTYEKHEQFKPIVLLKTKVEGDRKMLPNSFLNRFVKLYLGDFTVDNQIGYLQQKHAQITPDILEQLRQFVTLASAKNITLKLKSLQLFCQVYIHTNCLKRALKIAFLYNQSHQEIMALLEKTFGFGTLQYKPTRQEHHLVGYLPLMHQEFAITQRSDIDLLLDMFIVYQCSPYSIVLKGRNLRESKTFICRGFAWLLNLSFVHILLANNTDSAELLGTYEQAQVNGQPVFKYIESRLVQSLNTKSLVYIEVYSDKMVQRIEKGIEDIYDGKQRVIIGCEGLNLETVGVQIYYQHLVHQQQQLNNAYNADADDLLNKYAQEKILPANLTNYSLSTRYLSQKRLTEILNQLYSNIEEMSKSNKKMAASKKKQYQSLLGNILKSLRLVYNEVSHETLINHNPVSVQTDRQALIYQQMEELVLKQRQLTLVFCPELQELNTKLDLSSSMPKNFQQYQLQCRISYLFELDPAKADILLGQLTYDQQVKLRRSSPIFQRLFIVNPADFKSSALSMLSIIKASNSLLDKFLDQLENMAEGSSSSHLILIEDAMDSEITKRIPILNTVKNIKHYLVDLAQEEEPSFPVRAVFGLVNDQSDILPRYNSILPKYESQVLGSLQQTISQQDYQVVGASISNVSLKHTKLFDVFYTSFSKLTGHSGVEISTTIGQLFGRLGDSDRQNLTKEEKGRALLDMFRPRENINENISFYARNYQKYQTLSQYIDFQKVFYTTEQFLNAIRCGEFRPSTLDQLHSSISQSELELASLQKKIVYRGADNIDQLKNFFCKLTMQFRTLQEAKFSRQSILQFLREMFISYDRFKDVLLPIITGLLMILPDTHIYYGNVLMEQCKKVSMPDLIREFTANEVPDKFEQDNAKRYIILQRKLHQMVIDQFTKQGQQHHKDQQEQDFVENFKIGLAKDKEDPLEKIYGYFRQSQMDSYNTSLTNLNKSQTLEQLAVWLTLVLNPHSKEKLNIYSEWSLQHSRPLMEQLYNILSHLKRLLQSFQTQQSKSLCILVNAILDLKIFKTQVYKLLEGCEHIVDKIVELNVTLPKSMHIPESGLCEKIIQLRKVQMRNWYNMLGLKEARVERNDLVEFIGLWRQIMEEAQLGTLTDDLVFERTSQYLTQGSLGTFKLRMDAVECIATHIEQWVGVMRVHEFYSTFQQQHQTTVSELKASIEQEIKEYKQLAGWKSTNYLILKSTSEKFQRSIHKVLKKYEDQLKVPFSTIIVKQRENALAGSLEEYHSKFSHQAELPVTVGDIPEELEFSNQYEALIHRIFVDIQEMKSQSQNHQTRIRTLREYAKDLKLLFGELSKSITPTSRVSDRFVPDFSTLPKGSNMKKYYYSAWDKLNQKKFVQDKVQNKIDNIDQLWQVVENGWGYINNWMYAHNLKVESVHQKHNQFTTLERLLKPYGWALENPKPLKGHPIFQKEVVAFNEMIKHRQHPYHVKTKKPSDQELSEIYSFTKLVYVISNVVINLAHSGFCMKEEEEQKQGEGDDLKAGMGLGEADADKEAENIGDQIEFEEQLQGLKGQKEGNQDDMDNKQDKKDFDMQNDFNADAKSLESKSNQEQQEENSKIDEGFGDVSHQEENQVDKGQDSDKEDQGDNKKQDDLDYKTDKKPNKDDDIKAKEDPKDKKDTRNLGEDQFNEGSEGDEDSDMKPGQMLDQNQMEQQDNEDLQKESNSDQDDGNNDNGMEIESEDQKDRQLQEKQNEQGENFEEIEDTFEHKNQDKDMMEEEMAQQNDDGQEDQGQNQVEEEKPKLKSKAKPRKAPAYGVEGQQKNPLLQGQNKANQEQEQNDDEGEEARGDDNKQMRQQNSFSRQFIQEIIEAAQQTGNQEFKKNLNVVEDKLQEVDDQENAEGQEEKEGEQFAVSNNSKIKTNLTSHQQADKVDTIPQQESQEQEVGEGQTPKTAPKQLKEQIEQKKKTQESKPNPGKKQAAKQLVPSKQNKEKSQKKQVKSDPTTTAMDIEVAPSSSQKVEITIQQCNQIISNNKLKNQEETPADWGDDIFHEADKHSLQLYEQLKAVLEPQQVASYQGDYRTGKKLNMRKIIPFIASQYRKDRIWLRRSEPTDRNYQILIGIDDTKSMGINNVGRWALEGSFALALALSKLTIKTCITRMRDRMSVMHSFDQTFTQVSCKQITNKFGFAYQDVNSHNMVMPNFMRDSLAEFKRQKQKSSNDQTQQLCFIISDGRFNKNYVRPFLREAEQRGITYVFIIVDKPQNSIWSVREPVSHMNANGTFSFDLKKMYMKDFPFQYFLTIYDIKELSKVLTATLMQYFQRR